MLFGKYSKIFYAFNFRKVAQIQIQIQVYLSVHSAKTRATGHEPTPVSMTVFRGYCRRLGLAFSALNFSRGDNERWQLVAFDSSVCHWSRLNPAVSADQLHSVSHLSRTAIKHRHRSRRRLGGPFQMAGPGPRANKSHRFHFSTTSKSEKVCRREIKSEQPFSQLATEILIFPVCSARQLVALPRPTTFCWLYADERWSYLSFGWFEGTAKRSRLREVRFTWERSTTNLQVVRKTLVI